MHNGLFLPIFGELSNPRVTTSLAAEAEEAGFDGVFVWDHVQYRAPATHIADAWITLAAMAVATEQACGSVRSSRRFPGGDHTSSPARPQP